MPKPPRRNSKGTATTAERPCSSGVATPAADQAAGVRPARRGRSGSRTRGEAGRAGRRQRDRADEKATSLAGDRAPGAACARPAGAARTATRARPCPSASQQLGQPDSDRPGRLKPDARASSPGRARERRARRRPDGARDRARGPMRRCGQSREPPRRPRGRPCARAAGCRRPPRSGAVRRVPTIVGETHRSGGRTSGIEFRTLPPDNPNAELDGDEGACGGVGALRRRNPDSEPGGGEILAQLGDFALGRVHEGRPDRSDRSPAQAQPGLDQDRRPGCGRSRCRSAAGLGAVAGPRPRRRVRRPRSSPSFPHH